MESGIRKEEILNKIVHKLEAEGTFMEVVEGIIDDVEEILSTSHAAIMQISADNKWIDTVISYVGKDDKPMSITTFAMDKFAIAGDKLIACYSDSCTSAQGYIMDLCGADSSHSSFVYQ